jgi:membrane protein DedA with SNARE-associated domain
MELMIPDLGLIFWVFIYLLPTVIALISILKNDFKDSTTKLIWVPLVIFLGLIGAVLYFSIGRKQSIKKN